MPFVENQGAKLYWDEQGSGEPQITTPTLVIHGETDRLIPPANSQLIAERIPGAKLVLLPHASHIFETDQPGAAHHAILEFLAAQNGRKQPSRT
jgi:pimeloyl-ACP methyl ester carboxylesterase